MDAFIDLGDQFIALQKGRTQPPDDGRHFGLVVDDKEAVRRALADAGIKTLPGPFLDFLDPWGNRIEIVGYTNIQFTKAPHVLRGMGLSHLAEECRRHQGADRQGHGARLKAPVGEPPPAPILSWQTHVPRWSMTATAASAATGSTIGGA